MIRRLAPRRDVGGAGGVVGRRGHGHATVAATRPRADLGARTLSQLGDHVYPDMGNGGYTERPHGRPHGLRRTVQQVPAGQPRVLTDRATQCLTDFSLDLERTSVLPARPVPT